MLELFEEMGTQERRALLQITRSMSRERPRLAPQGDNVIEIRPAMEEDDR